MCFAVQVHAVSTQQWISEGIDDFSEGDMSDVTLSGRGMVLPAPSMTAVAGISADEIWDVLPLRDGSVIVATGNEAQLYRITAAGESREFADLSDILATALVEGSDGTIYAGTSPRGLIYAITPDGSVELKASLEVDYIWDMIIDTRGRLLVATGSEGKLLRVTPADGSVETIADLDDRNILCLLHGNNDSIYFGTDGFGLVYTLSADDTLNVVYDTAEDTVQSLAMDTAGNMYIGTAQWDDADSFDNGKTHEKSKPKTENETKKETEGFNSFGNGIKNTIYKITPNGAVQKILEQKDIMYMSMAVAADNSILVGTGNHGAVYTITTNGMLYRSLELETAQIMDIARMADGSYIFATANPGGCYIQQADYRKHAVYISDVHDIGHCVRWGKARWEGTFKSGTVLLATRTGATENPKDGSWSAWSDELKNPAGSLIQSPLGRFIQYKLIFTTDADTTTVPAVARVSIPYVPHNEEPVITDIKWLCSRDGKKARNLKIYERMLQWKVRDPNHDSCINSIYFRQQDTQQWILLKDELKQSEYIIDTRIIPDGNYYFKIIAADDLSNPKKRALTSEKITKIITIDNNAPVFSSCTAQRNGSAITISGSVHDTISIITNLRYSSNTRQWIPFDPADSVFDETTEDINITFTTKSSPAESILMIQAVDAVGNISTISVPIEE